MEPLVAEHGREVVLGWVRELLVSSTPATRSARWFSCRNMMTIRLRSNGTEPDLDGVVGGTSAIRKLGSPASNNSTGSSMRPEWCCTPDWGAHRCRPPREKRCRELGGHCNVEVDLETAERRYRGHQLEATFRTLTGCEDALIVNNNAAATLLTLQALCAGREVVISRGQLIEIGGSFRLPEIFSLSGALMREIGTTNRTHVGRLREGDHAQHCGGPARASVELSRDWIQ